MIKDKKEKQSGGSSSSSGGGSGERGSSSGGNNGNSKSNNSSNNNASNAANSGSTNNSNASPSSSKTSNSSQSSSSSSSTSSSGSAKSGGSNNANNKNNILGIKEEIIEQGPTEQLVVTSIKHEDGSPPTNIIKKEPANPSSSSGVAGTSASGSSSTSTVNSNDSNNNHDTNDNKNNSNLSGNPDEKDSANDNSITDELLHNDDLNSSGNNSSSNKLGLHIKSEQDASSGNLDPLGGVDNTFGQMNSQQPGSNRPNMMTSPERIQPLPSNVVNKSNSMDYMQQQSQIFVFSTQLANKGAEAVRNGQFPTIIAYHCAQPDTRKILSKFPLKTNQFTRSPNWFPPNMNPMGNPSGPKRSKMMPMNQQNFNFMNKNNPQQQQQLPHQQQQGGPVNNQMGMQQGFQGSCDMNVGPGGDLWGGPGNQQMMDPLGNGANSIDPLLSDSIESLVNDPLATNSMSSLQGNFMDPTSPSIPSLQGVKVPDEDLTPQQRQERVKKLKQLEDLKLLLKQEHSGINPDLNALGEDVPSGVVPPGPNMNLPCNKMPPNPIGGQMNPMMQGNPQPGMMNSPHGNMPMNGPMRPNFPPGMGGMGPRGPNMGNIRGQMPPNMGGMNMNPEEMMMGANAGSPMGGPGPGMNNMHMQGPGNMMNMPGMGPMQGGNNMGMNNMVPGMNNMPGGPMMGNQKGMVGPGGPMGAPGGNMQQQMEWNKMQQYYEENKRKGMGGPMPGGMDMPMNDMNMPPGMAGPGRMGPMNRNPNMPNMPNMRLPQQQGPPPPYHQTPRSASVPIATQSPNPNSPNNPTSNLSLPSPRGGCNSTLNSPAAGDPSRMNPQQFKHMNPRQSPTTSSQDSPAGAMGGGRQINHSNPSTPISSHLSPSASLKDLEMSTNPNKEPNLMPVPSPQQISYLNTFEGQELTIQKQPNTNISNKDGAPNMVGPNQANMNLDNRLPGQKTPTSSANPHMNNFPIPSSPHTPGGAPSLGGDKNRINPSPQNPLQRSNSMMGNDPQQFPPHHMQGNNQQSNESNMPFSTDAQNMPFGPNSLPMQSNAKMPNFMDQKPGDMTNGPPQFPQCGGRPENLPLNPNSNAAMPSTKPAHFDPISSLAQMSQQLTSTGVPGSMNGQSMMGGFNNNGMMNDMGPMGGMNDGQMDFGGNMGGMGPNPNQFPPMGPRSMSPKIGPQGQMGFPGPGGMPPNMRMVRPPMGYNGTNIQVKPNAPNTIQYLPARPQMNNSNPPRGPPSLEFLQRYTNPMNMDDMNKGAPGGNQQNMPYFPNQNNPNSCGSNPMDPLGDMTGGNGPNSMLPGSGPAHGMMNQNPMMMRGPGGGMRGSGGNMMRFPSPNANMGGNPCMMGNNTFNSSNNPNMGGPNDHQMNQMMMFGGGGPNPQNPQMFVPGPKSSPMAGGPVNSEMQMGGPPQMGGPGQPHFNKQQPPQQQQQQSHFPSTADPNYAQQYHNFQQQLYATNNTNQRNQMGMQNQNFMTK